jgi:uncharacterized DUF497 family protein
MRFKYSRAKSTRLRATRGVGFDQVQEMWNHPYYLDQRREVPEQWRAIGWVGERLYSVIFEERMDANGEYIHLVTLWRATKEEEALYEQNR